MLVQSGGCSGFSSKIYDFASPGQLTGFPVTKQDLRLLECILYSIKELLVTTKVCVPLLHPAMLGFAVQRHRSWEDYGLLPSFESVTIHRSPYRKPQQSKAELGAQAQLIHVRHTLCTSQKRGQKDCKSQKIKEFVVRFYFLEMSEVTLIKHH